MHISTYPLIYCGGYGYSSIRYIPASDMHSQFIPGRRCIGLVGNHCILPYSTYSFTSAGENTNYLRYAPIGAILYPGQKLFGIFYNIGSGMVSPCNVRIFGQSTDAYRRRTLDHYEPLLAWESCVYMFYNSHRVSMINTELKLCRYR